MQNWWRALRWQPRRRPWRAGRKARHGCSAATRASQNLRAALQVWLRERREKKCAFSFNAGSAAGSARDIYMQAR